MNIHKLIEEALDQKELVRVLNAADLALKEPDQLLRMYASEAYNGAAASPIQALRELKIKVESLLRLAEVSDEISFCATETAEEARISLLTKSDDLISGSEKMKVEQYRLFLGLRESSGTKKADAA